MIDYATEAGWSPGKVLTLQSKRLILRSLGLTDATPEYLSWWDDPDVQRGLNMPPRKWSVIDAQRHIARFNNRDTFHLGIFLRETGQLIGFTTTICNLSNRTATRNTVIGNKGCWSQGFGQEISCEISKFVFDKLNMHKLVAHIETHNIASRTMVDRMGYILEGVLREEAITPDGRRTDICVYGLLKQEWEAQGESA